MLEIHPLLWTCVHPTADGIATVSQHLRMPDTINFSCITNRDQLYALFKNTLAREMHQGGGSTLLLFQMHIHKAASQSSINASNHLENKCCEASDTQDICTRTAVYSRAILYYMKFYLIHW